MDNLLNYALHYAKKGLAVFPVRPKDKAPATAHGFKDATTDETKIINWWKKNPNYNIGIACGSMSNNLLVVDIDVDTDTGDDGYGAVSKFEHENGEFPETAMVQTGKGGSHRYYFTDKPIPGRIGVLEHVDIRGEGNYVVAPPSIHPNGTQYEWELNFDDITEIAHANESVIKLAMLGAETEKGEDRQKFQLPNVIKKGARNDTCYSYACSLQAKGYSDETIKDMVIGALTIRSEVPPTASEIEEYKKTVESALSHAKGELRLPHFTKHGPKQDYTNVMYVFENDEKLKYKFGWNSLRYEVCIKGAVPWIHKEITKPFDNHDVYELLNYFDSVYELHDATIIMNCLDIIAKRNEYNPLIEHLEALPKWDGKPHVENLLPDYLGAEKNLVNTASMRTWMLGAVKRAYEPGCKLDYMPVLVGEQGAKKSTFLRKLAMISAWFDDNFSTIEGKEACDKLRGMWIVEMAELLASKRTKDVEAIKAFITSREDSYRPPYERKTERRPRMVAFAGTTNDETFLSDSTGNRRFLPIRVHKGKATKDINSAEAEEEIKQAWAEILYWYKTEHPEPIFPYELENDLEQVRTRFTIEDAWKGMIEGWIADTNMKKFCVRTIWLEALNKHDDTAPTRYESKTILQLCKDIAPKYGYIYVDDVDVGKFRHQRGFIKIGREAIPEAPDVEF